MNEIEVLQQRIAVLEDTVAAMAAILAPQLRMRSAQAVVANKTVQNVGGSPITRSGSRVAGALERPGGIEKGDSGRR